MIANEMDLLRWIQENRWSTLDSLANDTGTSIWHVSVLLRQLYQENAVYAEQGHWRLAKEEDRHPPLAEAKDAMQECIQMKVLEDPLISVMRFAHCAVVSESTARRCFGVMKDAGLLCREGNRRNGQWRLRCGDGSWL